MFQFCFYFNELNSLTDALREKPQTRNYYYASWNYHPAKRYVGFRIKRALMTAPSFGGAPLRGWVRLKRKTCARVVLSRKSPKPTAAFVPPYRSSVPTRPISLPSCFIQERKEHGKEREGRGVEECTLCLGPQNTYNYIDDITYIHTHVLPNVKWFSLVNFSKPSSLLCYSRMCFTDNHVIKPRLSGFTIVEIKRGNKAMRQLDRYKVLISFLRF